MRTSIVGVWLLDLAFSLTVFASEAGWGQHKKLYVVPAPGKVVIDGKLDDWDSSARLNVFVYRETSELESARFAMMYDAEALYASAVVRDPTPMRNRHDPHVDPNKAWDADVCQLYINLDPALGYPLAFSSFADNQGKDRDLVQLYLWYFSDREEPCLAVFRGMKNEPAWGPVGRRGAVQLGHAGRHENARRRRLGLRRHGLRGAPVPIE